MRIQPKKSLGQNFLIDRNIRKKIINSLSLEPTDIVFEIGSGRGELSEEIARIAARVYALEIDSSLCTLLEEKLKGYSNIKILNLDILKFKIDDYFAGISDKMKVVGNIPYYISSPIIEHLLKNRGKIKTIFLMLQKEFAERLVADPGSKVFGSFSLFAQYYTEPKIIFNVSRNSFFPKPKVDSSFLRLDLRQELPLDGNQETQFFRIVRSAFNKRRKTLRNSLKGIVPVQKIESFFMQYCLDKNTRPEELSLGQFINLSRI